MTIPSSTLNIEHMNYYKYYKNLRLDELDIASDEEAEELEFELELRFEEFTPRDRNTWLQQNTYLEHFSRIGSVTSAAREAGVTVYKAQTWKFDNVLGFTRRLEVADLAFNDRLKEKALRRASDPKAPATLLIELLRAYIPEQFSRNGHKCDTSKSDELLRHFREDARREMEAGHPTLRKIAEGATNAHPHDDHVPSYSQSLPHAVRPTRLQSQPLDGGEIQRGGSLHTDPHAHQPSHDDIQPRDACETLPHEPTSPTRHSRVGGNPQTVSHKANWAKPDPKRPDVARPTRRLQSRRQPTPRHGTVPPLPRRERLTQRQSLPTLGERHREGVPPAPSAESNSDNKEKPKRKTPSP